MREGWDNPNVFQICTLKQSDSDIRKRQEVGRGLRLCVNQDGVRQDENILGGEVHKINSLTVIAGESYEEFTRKLQSEIAESVNYRPRAVTKDLFVGKIIQNAQGGELKIDSEIAESILYEMTVNRYIDKKGFLTDKYFDDKKSGNIKLADEVADFKESVIEIIDTVYNGYKIKDSKSDNVTAKLDENKIAMPEFQALWKKINAKTVYHVDFDTDEFVEKTIAELNQKLHVAKIYFRLESGSLGEIKSREDLEAGTAFTKKFSTTVDANEIKVVADISFDIIGKLIEETGLMRATIIKILGGMNKEIFSQFKYNPEEFILQASKIINSQKSVTVIEHIKYNATGETYDINIFNDDLKGSLNLNAIATEKILYDFLIYDSKIERDFAKGMEISDKVTVYVKLPKNFYISTPVGKYNPDWAIVFNEGEDKHIYFVAETKGSMDSIQLRLIEDTKIECARRHFKTIAGKNICYEVVSSYKDLLDILKTQKA